MLFFTYLSIFKLFQFDKDEDLHYKFLFIVKNINNMIDNHWIDMIFDDFKLRESQTSILIFLMIIRFFKQLIFVTLILIYLWIRMKIINDSKTKKSVSKKEKKNKLYKKSRRGNMIIVSIAQWISKVTRLNYIFKKLSSLISFNKLKQKIRKKLKKTKKKQISNSNITPLFDIYGTANDFDKGNNDNKPKKKTLTKKILSLINFNVVIFVKSSK